MNKQNKRSPCPTSKAPAGRGKIWVGLVAAVGLIVGFGIWKTRQPPQPSPVQANNPVSATNANLPSADVAQALMVTVELDFGGTVPSIKEALTQIERRYEPESGRERTFAILDAYGEPTPAGKLHLSMHVSMERPGIGSLIFRRTGEVLWKSRIVPAKSGPPAEKNLKILMDDGSGRMLVLDGSQGAASVMDVPLRDSTTLIRNIWPDGMEREFTFIYSSCGCPVKAKVRRTGETSERTSELPVMFPDDPAALAAIRSLMGWTKP